MEPRASEFRRPDQPRVRPDRSRATAREEACCHAKFVTTATDANVVPGNSRLMRSLVRVSVTSGAVGRSMWLACLGTARRRSRESVHSAGVSP